MESLKKEAEEVVEEEEKKVWTSEDEKFRRWGIYFNPRDDTASYLSSEKPAEWSPEQVQYLGGGRFRFLTSPELVVPRPPLLLFLHFAAVLVQQLYQDC